MISRGPAWQGFTGLSRCTALPSCSPRHGEPGSPARDKQSVLTAVAPLQTVQANNATKTQDIFRLWVSKADLASAAVRLQARWSRMMPVVLAGLRWTGWMWFLCSAGTPGRRQLVCQVGLISGIAWFCTCTEMRM